MSVPECHEFPSPTFLHFTHNFGQPFQINSLCFVQAEEEISVDKKILPVKEPHHVRVGIVFTRKKIYRPPSCAKLIILFKPWLSTGRARWYRLLSMPAVYVPAPANLIRSLEMAAKSCSQGAGEQKSLHALSLWYLEAPKSPAWSLAPRVLGLLLVLAWPV